MSYLAALARARAVLAEATPDTEHDHRGPDPCPACGGEPPEPGPLTSWHPNDRYQPLGERLTEAEESE